MVRTAFYSHDTFGLGHLRRCLKLAEALGDRIPDSEGVLVTGSPWPHLFSCPNGFEIIPLPPIVKRGQSYRAFQRGVNLRDLIEFRSRRLDQLLHEYRPDLLVVDNVPCGLMGEMLPALRNLAAAGATSTVLALRDVLDSPEQVHREWSAAGAREALHNYYHEVWILGDDAAANAMDDLPGLDGVDVQVCGRIGLEDLGPQLGTSSSRGSQQVRAPGATPRVLVSGGGGGDAVSLVDAVIGMQSEATSSLRIRMVLGPDYPDSDLPRALDAERLGIRVDRFVADLPAAMADVDVVIAMAGYNTTCEIEAVGVRSVLVPRVWPRQEQWIRARRQMRAGRAILLHPDELDPATLFRAVQTALERPAPPRLRNTGAQVAAYRAAELLGREADSRFEGAVAS